MRIVLAVLGLLVLSPAASARDLPVPPDKGWQHAASGVVLTATLAGLPRTSLVDSGTDERDVAAEFASPDRSTIATIFIFHPGLPGVPIWFDRAQTALELKDVYGGARPASAQPAAFALPGAARAAGLRQTYTPAHGPYRATALAVMPVGEWLVAVRLSSRTLDPVTIDPALTDILSAIRFPAAGEAMPTAVPVEPCTDQLTYAQAKIIKPDLRTNVMQMILGSAMASKASTPAAAVPEATVWCREPMKPTVDYGVYRSGAGDGYTLAIADAGRSVDVYRGFALPGDPSAGYAVTFHDLDGSTQNFPSFDKLPQPDQVFALVTRGQAVATTTTTPGQTTVTIGVPK